MRIAGRLLIAAALLPWPWIASAPQAAATPPAGIGLSGAPTPLRLVADHDQGEDQDHGQRQHHKRRHHHHRRHGNHHDQDNHGHGDHGH